MQRRHPYRGAVLVRPRRPQDLAALVPVLERTHREVGYPVRTCNVRAGWLAEPVELGGWVAEQDGRVVGHVALHPASGACAPLWREATGRPEDGLAVVSRLLSDARGAGSALLACAEAEAALRGRVPVLEVELDSAARPFYRRRGWTEVGQVDQRWGEHDVRVAVMVRHPVVSGGSTTTRA